MKRTVLVLAALSAISLRGFALRAEEAQSLEPQPLETQALKFQRVFVFDSTAKPAEALGTGRYICRIIDKGHPALLSSECQATVGVTRVPGTRALPLGKAERQVFICPHCGRLIWQDTGRDIKLTQQSEKMTEKDLEAIVKITTELVEGTARPQFQTVLNAAK